MDAERHCQRVISTENVLNAEQRIQNAMPTLDELKGQLELFKTMHNKGMKTSPKARPTPLLADNGKTCKSCNHAVRVYYHNKRYYKCELVKMTHGPGTDIRLKDPACARYEEEVDEVSNESRGLQQ